MFKNVHSKFFVFLYPEVKDSLSEEQIKALQSISQKLKRNPLKIASICSHPAFPAIQTSDIFHDMLKGKISVIPEMELFHVVGSADAVNKQITLSQNRCFTNQGPILMITSKDYVTALSHLLEIDINSEYKSGVFYEFNDARGKWNSLTVLQK